MTANTANLKIRMEKNGACIKVTGRANFNLAVDFKRLLSLLLQQKPGGDLRIELSECALMDSTFLGVLAGFGLRRSQPVGQTAARPLQLLNPNERVTELLENLGVLHLFDVVHEPTNPTPPTEEAPPTGSQPSREEITRTCLEAHQQLAEINPENEPRFRDVTKFLAEDLKRIQNKS